MTTKQLVQTLGQSAAEFLAKKHGVPVDAIYAALIARNERIAEQMADLIATAYEATREQVPA
jgi:hypothetical protein